MVIQQDSYGTVALVIVICIILMVLTLVLTNKLWIQLPVVLIMLFCCCFIVYFFRVPERTRPCEDGLVTSVADGEVVIIEKTFEKEYLQKECIQVSVYMDFFDVHTNFWPFDGKVTYYKYHPGKYLLAFLPKASELNEHASAVLSYGAEGYTGPGAGTEILFKQIAGTFARRIVNYSKVGDYCKGGEMCGVIKFGSRLDMFLPLDAEILVKIGDKVQTITTPIARLK